MTAKKGHMPNTKLCCVCTKPITDFIRIQKVFRGVVQHVYYHCANGCEACHPECPVYIFNGDLEEEILIDWRDLKQHFNNMARIIYQIRNHGRKKRTYAR